MVLSTAPCDVVESEPCYLRTNLLFALLTLGIMDLDPVRMKRRQKSTDEDRSAVLDFVAKWKEFDWTLSLDG